MEDRDVLEDHNHIESALPEALTADEQIFADISLAADSLVGLGDEAVRWEVALVMDLMALEETGPAVPSCSLDPAGCMANGFVPVPDGARDSGGMAWIGQAASDLVNSIAAHVTVAYDQAMGMLTMLSSIMVFIFG